MIPNSLYEFMLSSSQRQRQKNLSARIKESNIRFNNYQHHFQYNQDFPDAGIYVNKKK